MGKKEEKLIKLKYKKKCNQSVSIEKHILNKS